jgi:hypothetical protein
MSHRNASPNGGINHGDCIAEVDGRTPFPATEGEVLEIKAQ